MKTFMSFFGAIIVALVIFSSCGSSKRENDKSIVSGTNSEVMDKKTDTIGCKQESKPTTNCSVKISKSYTDFTADPESGDMGGSVSIDFIQLSKNNYDAKIEQRYGTEGNTYPTQKVKNLMIDDKGTITFEVKWFDSDTGDKSKSKIVKAKGTINKKVLKFKTDIPNNTEYVLDFVNNN